MDNVYTFVVDVLFQRNGLSFVWNVQKAAANRDKHGITFERASEVFSIPSLVYWTRRQRTNPAMRYWA